MKNNTLKKISAIALAAVMAVTFAPVASLNAFAANDPVTVSGTGSLAVDKGYPTLSAAAQAVAASGYRKATITLNDTFTAAALGGTAATEVVTGAALAVKGTAATGDVFFGGGDYTNPMEITLDLGTAPTFDLSVKTIGIAHDTYVTIVDSDTTTTGSKLGKFRIGAIEKTGDRLGWGNTKLTVDMNDGNHISEIDAYYSEVSLKSGSIDGDVKFEAGDNGAVNIGPYTKQNSINASTFTMDGGFIGGFIKNADASQNAVGNSRDASGNVTEGLGKVTINNGTFEENPLGTTVANCNFDWDKYNDTTQNATFGFVTKASKTASDTTQDTSMIGNTPVARVKVGATNYYYAGQDTIDAAVKSIKASNANDLTNYFKNVNTQNIEIVANPVAINKAPWGSVIYCLNRVAGAVKSPTAVTVDPASGVSKYTTVAVTGGAAFYDTETKVYVGDRTIQNQLSNKSVEEADAEFKAKKGSAEFKNGGNTLEIKADGKTYVNPKYLNEKILKSAKEVTVVELSNLNSSNTGYKYALLGGLDETFGEIASTSSITAAATTAYNQTADKELNTNGLASGAKVTADKKYTVVDSKAGGKRYVAVTESRVVYDEATGPMGGNIVETYDPNTQRYYRTPGAVKQVRMAPAAGGNATANVQQIGESELADTGANGILFINGVSGKGAVTSDDKNTPIAYNGTVTLVGDSAAQIASVSSTGRNTINQYAIAGKGDFIPARFTVDGPQTYVQGKVYLPEVPRDWNMSEASGNVSDKDAVTTWIDFVDGNTVGITKTPNITTNGYGVQMVSSVNVNIGGDTNTARSVYRFRNTKNGEHLYTVENTEINNLLKSEEWVLENANAFTVLPYNTTVAGAVPVRRYHNIKTNEFLYSTDVNGEQKALDADPNWVREGIAFCGLPTGQGYAVTRVTNTIFGGHVYSTSVKNEVTPLIESGKGYKVDGVVFNAVETPEKEK